MTLREAIDRLAEWPKDATLFVERIRGGFLPESNADVLALDDADARPINEIAAERTPGKEYFLEVSIARDVIAGWRYNHAGQSPSLADSVAAIIYYAENDAYPAAFYGTASNLDESG